MPKMTLRTKIFFSTFTIIALLNLNFSILRSVRNTLVVAGGGGSASYIPYFELFGALPGAILMTYGFTKLLSRFSMHKVFLISLTLFLLFFLIATLGVYPFLPESLHVHFSFVFYVVAELWKVGLLTVLFWGLVNQYMPLAEAKTLYAPLMLAGSIGAMLASPLIAACSSQVARERLSISDEPWTQALILMMLLLSLAGIATAYFYQRLFKQLQLFGQNDPPKEALRLGESVKSCFRSRYLLLLGWIVLVDYVAYSLGEVIFLDILKERFPLPCDYCNWMGNLSLWSGILTAISALILTPWILRRFHWTVAALATPLCLLVTEGAFFLVLRSPFGKEWFGWTHLQWLEVVVFLGSLQYCLCRAAKYTLFDSSKELALVPLSPALKMQGKLVIDGIGSRLGRGSASILSIFLIEISGGVLNSSGPTGILAIGLALSWIFATGKLGEQVEVQNANRT